MPPPGAGARRWVTWPGAGSLSRPRPLPPLSSFPPWWSPSPVPLCLYFYSLILLSPLPSRAVILHLHTHTHIYTHIPTTHIHTHTATRRHLHTHTSIHTHAHTHTPLSGKAQPWGVRARGSHCSGSDAHSASLRAFCYPFLAFPFRGGAWGWGVHEERLSQGRLPHGAWESPVELHEDWEPPGVTLEMLFQQPPGHTLAQPG